FGDVHRIAEQRQSAAEDRDLDLFGALDEGAGDQIRCRHQPIGILVMLVDGDAVEAQPFAIDEEVDEIGIFLGAFDRIVKAVREYDPGRAMFRSLLEIEMTIRHQMEGYEFHRDASARKSRKGSIVSFNFSTCGTCPHFSIMTSRAPGRRSRDSPA